MIGHRFHGTIVEKGNEARCSNFLEDIDNVEGLEKSLEKDLVENRVSLNGSLLKTDIESFVKFENFQKLVTQLTDLKEFFSYKLDNLRKTTSEALIQ